MSDFLKKTLDTFEEQWNAAIPCDDYAIVQLSPRKVLVLKLNRGSRGISNGVRMPARYDIVTICKNRYLAEIFASNLAKSDEAEKEVWKKAL